MYTPVFLMPKNSSTPPSSHLASGGFLQQFVNKRLVGLVLLGRQPSQPCEQFRRNSQGDQLFCLAGLWAPDAACPTQFGICRFGNMRKIDGLSRNTLFAFSSWHAARCCSIW